MGSHTSGGEAFGKVGMGINVRLYRSHAQKYGGLGLTPMRVVNTRALPGLACLDTSTVGHNGRYGNRGSRLFWRCHQWPLAEGLGPLVTRSGQLVADFLGQRLEVTWRDRQISNGLEQPGRLLERTGGRAGDDRDGHRFRAVAAMS